MAPPNDKIRDEVRKGYDNIAPKYLEWTKPSFERRLSYLQKVLTSLEVHNDNASRVNVLEMGCGAGVPTTQALSARSNFAVTANDISAAQIALAKEHLPSSVKLVESDMMSLKFASGTLDLVVAMYAIIHLPKDDQVDLLRRVFDWLRPGGCFLANFAVEEIELASEPNWLGCTEGTMYWGGWGTKKTCEILTEIGFDIFVQDVVREFEDAGDGAREVSFLWVIAKKI